MQKKRCHVVTNNVNSIKHPVWNTMQVPPFFVLFSYYLAMDQDLFNKKRSGIILHNFEPDK